jgi:proteic killer suppression protein
LRYNAGVHFKDQGTADIFHGIDSKAARRTCPASVRAIALRKLAHLDFATSLDDLRIPIGNQLEALCADRAGQHSVRINSQYRVCFRWTVRYGAVDVEIVDYH